MADDEAEDKGVETIVLSASPEAQSGEQAPSTVKLFNRNRFQVSVRLKNGLDACLAPSGWSGKFSEADLPDQLPLGVHKKQAS